MAQHASLLEKSVVAAILIVCLGICFLPVTDAGFIWDDDDYVTMNPNLRDAQGLIDTWTDPSSLPQYYPLVHTTFWLEYQAWELDPLGYHINNLLLHAIGAFLLFLVLRQLGIAWAAAVAILFAVHPVQVESVAWVTERKNCLSLVFYLLAMRSFLLWWPVTQGEPTGRKQHYALALVFFLCALLSKTVTCSLPAALLLIFWWRRGKVTGALVKGLAPFLAIGIGMAALTVWLEANHVKAQGIDWELSFIERILIAARAIWFYIATLIWPADLSFNYPRWTIDTGSAVDWLYPLAFVSLLALLFVKRTKLTRGPVTALCLFAGTLFPALGFIDVYPMRYSFVADHFQYLATPFLLVLLVQLARAGFEKARINNKGAMISGLCIAGVFMALTYRHAQRFQDLETLWRETIKANPTSWLARLNLGVMKLNTGDLDEARELLLKAEELKPGEPDIENNLGILYFETGDKQKAREYFESSLDVRGDSPQVLHNLGVTLWESGEQAEGRRLVEEALELAPGYADAQGSLARFLLDEGAHKRALKLFKAALREQPENLRFLQGLATCLIEERQFKEAAFHLAFILSRDPLNVDARLAIVTCLNKGGKYNVAESRLLEILRIVPRNEKAADEVLRVLKKKTDSQAKAKVESWAVANKAIRGFLFELLARHFESRRNWDEAAKAWTTALEEATARQESEAISIIEGRLKQLKDR